MKINIGIVGYGNLGKAVEQLILSNPNFNLVAIFSRRLITSKFNTKIEPYNNFLEYKNKIDIMLLCGGSKSDLESQTREICKHFDIINTFDTHAKIADEFKNLNKIAKKHNRRAIICCGWDPGIFSIIRGLFFAISKNNSYTFWGKGLSMGHSDAVRQVENVDDGIQFTIPINESIKKARQGILESFEPMHKRECFVVADEKHFKQIEKDIKNIPHYFKGQPTNINFVSAEKLLKLKANKSHKGFIINKFKTISGYDCKMEFSVSMKSNPDFTASIMIAYINAVINLKQNRQNGAFTNLDIPISYLFKNFEHEKLLKTIC